MSTKRKPPCKEENIVIGQELVWNKNRRAIKHRKPEDKRLTKITVKQVHRPDKLVRVVLSDGTKVSLKFKYVMANYLAEKPELKVQVNDYVGQAD